MPARFTVYQDVAGGWRWRFQAANGRVMADSAESYTSSRNASRALAAFLEAIPSAETD